MNPKTVIKTLLLAIILLPGLAFADFFDKKGTFEDEIMLDGPVVLHVDTGSGSIDVRSGSGSRAIIKGEIRVRKRMFFGRSGDAKEILTEVQENPPIILDDGHLRVGHFEDRGLAKRVSISYEIVVPADTEVVADTGSGSITIRDIAAPVSADTGSGSIKLENIGGPVRADTGSGSIHADGVGGAFHADTGSGSVYLMQTAPGDVRVDTGSGSSELLGVVGALHADSGSGRIIVQGRQEGRWLLDTGSGSIRIDLPDDAAFDLDAQSRSGGITIDHPLTMTGTISKRHVKGEVRGGGPELSIDTGSGSIKVE
ncbi:MAG: DUF4097 family beta strand repeat-containing protein [Woeseiaceae bacterium]|nr:DUF4097 family beta strand repeat-containing protein [Woeseiaceae bacterium]